MKEMKDKFLEICDRIEGCQRCSLHKGINNYVPGVLGSTFPQLLFVGEAPGFDEDLQGLPFIGKSGKLLQNHVKEIFGLSYGEYTILNSVICRPPDNRQPTEFEKGKCYPWLQERLRLIKPTFIISLGKHAGLSLTGEKSSTKLEDILTKFYVCKNTNCHLIPTYHPMATEYVKHRKEKFISDLNSIKNGDYLTQRERVDMVICQTRPKSLWRGIS